MIRKLSFGVILVSIEIDRKYMRDLDLSNYMFKFMDYVYSVDVLNFKRIKTSYRNDYT